MPTVILGGSDVLRRCGHFVRRCMAFDNAVFCLLLYLIILYFVDSLLYH